MFRIILALFLVVFSVNSYASADKQAIKDKLKESVEKYEKYKAKIAEFEKSDKYKGDLLSEDQPFEVTVGNPDAPVKVVEYMSLTCVHCKEFHEKTYYDLKKNYIDEGKVFMKIRHFPLNGAAVKGVLVLDCVAEQDKQAFIGALLKSQPQWAYVKTEAQLIDRLKTVSKIGGLNEEQFNACYNDTEKQDKLLSMMKEAAEGLLIDSTPALYVDGTRYLGAKDYDTFSKMIDEKLANNNSKKDGGSKEVAADAANEEKTP